MVFDDAGQPQNRTLTEVKREAWEASSPDENERTLFHLIARYVDDFSITPGEFMAIGVQARATGEDQKEYLAAKAS